MNIGIYLRLSVNNSIENQKKIIYNYINSSLSSVSSIREYEDNGFSGTKSDRPSLLRLISDCKHGNIDCVIIKDFSRLARDYITAGKLIDNFFPNYNIRLISISDNYDSSKKDFLNESSISIKNIAYALYSRDLSSKIHTAKKALSEKGVYTCSICPTGYKKGIEKNSIEIDENKAHIIKFIFEKTAENVQPVQLAVLLNSENSAHLYTPNEIRKIVHNEFYTGKFKNNENHHKAIIAKELFIKANANLKTRCFNSYTINNSRLLAKKIFCKNCGRMLYYRGKNIKYYCPTQLYARNTQCYNGNLYEKDIVNIVVEILTPYINNIISNDIIPFIDNIKKTINTSISRTEYLIKTGTKDPEKQAEKLIQNKKKIDYISSLPLYLTENEICNLIEKIEISQNQIAIYI